MRYPRIAGLIIIALALFSFSKERGNRDVDEYQLKGKVKSVIEISQSMDSSAGTPKIVVFGKVRRTFNEQGNLKEILIYDAHDSVVRRETDVYKHNGQKRVSYIQDYHKRQTGKKQKERAYVYDKNGKLVKLTYFTPAGLKNTISEYDGLGYRCSVTQFSRHNGGLPQKILVSYNYNYDSTGRITQEYAINEDGSLLDKYIHKYDKKGREIETDIYNTDSTLSRKISAQFDSLGNPIDINDAYYFIGGGDMGQKRSAIYDDNGFKTEEDTYRIKPDGTMVLEKSALYENDKVGNWIKETTFYNNKKGAVVTRAIEYY
jgi:hypothetical protein